MQIDIFKNLEIINHIKTYSKIFKPSTKQEWIQVLCPYCDDAYRKEYITHGHFYISRFSNFSQCFRCETKTSTKQYLLDIGFINKSILDNIFKSNTNIIYSQLNKKGRIDSLDVLEKNYNFKKKYPNDYKLYLNFILNKISYSDLNFFKIYPLFIEDKLAIGLNNYNNEVSTIRFISKNNIKYFKLDSNIFYFFQNHNTYNNIVVCESAFDLINLYKYSTIVKNKETFFIAINGRSYVSDISKIISNYFLIGNYLLNVVFDKDVNLKIKNKINSKINLLNPNIFIKYYTPIVSKDVSDCNLLQQC